MVILTRKEARAEMLRLSGCLSLPDDIEQKAGHLLSTKKGYTSYEIIRLLLKVAKENKVTVNKQIISQVILQTKLFEPPTMAKERYICLVCGYHCLEEGPMQFKVNDKKIVSYKKGAPTFEICPCCGTEFGFDDEGLSWEQLRKMWIKKRGKLFRKEKKSKNWNLKDQLLNLRKIDSLRIGELICKTRSDIDDLKPSDYISDKIAANASDSDIQEILMEYNINNHLFSLFTWGYLKKNSLDPIFIKNIFKRYLKEPNKLRYILGILLKIKLPKRRDDNIKNLLNRSLHYYYQKYKKWGITYFDDCGGIGFIISIIIAIGKFQVTKAIPLLKKMTVDLKMDEPNLSRAAQEAIENIKKNGGALQPMVQKQFKNIQELKNIIVSNKEFRLCLYRKVDLSGILKEILLHTSFSGKIITIIINWECLGLDDSMGAHCVYSFNTLEKLLSYLQNQMNIDIFNIKFPVGLPFDTPTPLDGTEKIEDYKKSWKIFQKKFIHGKFLDKKINLIKCEGYGFDLTIELKRNYVNKFFQDLINDKIDIIKIKNETDKNK